MARQTSGGPPYGNNSNPHQLIQPERSAEQGLFFLPAEPGSGMRRVVTVIG